MSHSILPPSSAHIWGSREGCTGWVTMSQAFPETEDSEEAREGTASHEIGAEIIHAGCVARLATCTPEKYVGRSAENGVVLTGEMFDAAKMYADDVHAVQSMAGIYGGPNLRIEERVEIPSVHEYNWGTPDSAIYDRGSSTLYVWDYKFGFEVVEAFENWQLLDYASGLLDVFGITGQVEETTRVVMRIVQPRAFHRDGPIREWVITVSELRTYEAILRANAHLALGTGAEFRTGPHCKHCPGRLGKCAPAIKAGMGMYEAVGAPLPTNPTPEEVGVQLSIVKRARKQLEYLESGLEEQVKGLIHSGKLVRGWGTAETYGREKWAKPVAEVLALGDMLEFNLRKPEEAITPNEAKKLGIDAAVITAYSTKPRTGLKIVPDNGNKAKQVFSK